MHIFDLGRRKPRFINQVENAPEFAPLADR
jgi:hypothetical protein